MRHCAVPGSRDARCESATSIVSARSGRLPARFDFVARPARGRYVVEPARTDGNGVVFVPPPLPDPVPRLVAGAVAGVVVGASIAALRRRN